jgi:hypothetical protein
VAGADVELREHLAQVVLDGAATDEQPRIDFVCASAARLAITGTAMSGRISSHAL